MIITENNQSVTPGVENVNLTQALEVEKTYICAKIKEFALFKRDLVEHLATSVVAENLEILSDLLAETENSGDEYYTYLLSIYGVIVEKEIIGE